MTPTPPFVVAHRGDSIRCPENTEAAVRSALAVGVQAVECDVQLSADGRPVVFHDDDLARLVGSKLRVDACTEADLLSRTVRVEGRSGAPARILSLRAWFESIPADVLPVIELKPQATAEQELRLADVAPRELGPAAERAVWISFSPTIVERLKRASPERSVGPITSRPLDPSSRRELVERAQGCVVVKKTLLDPELVEAVHASGQQLFVYALDEETEIRHALLLGVDGLISNAPAVAVPLVESFRRE